MGAQVPKNDAETIEGDLGASRSGRGRRRTHSKAVDRTGTRWLSVVASVAIVGIVLGSLSVGFLGAVRTTRTLTAPGLANQYRTNLKQFNCLQQEVRKVVPDHATVHLGGVGSNAQQAEELSEYATPWVTPTVMDTAKWRLVLTRGTCAGLGIFAERSD
jgi:hypothetical protein